MFLKISILTVLANFSNFYLYHADGIAGIALASVITVDDAVLHFGTIWLISNSGLVAVEEIYHVQLPQLAILVLLFPLQDEGGGPSA